MNLPQNKLIDVSHSLSSVPVKKYLRLQPELYEKVLRTASGIKGLKVAHIAGSRLKKERGRYVIGGNGGLSEILKSQIPLENSLGLDSRLYLASLPSNYYSLCKRVFDRIVQKESADLSENDKSIFTNQIQKMGRSVVSEFKRGRADIIIVHDFEYLPVVGLLPEDAMTILHWHVDFPPKNTEIVKVLKPYIKKFDLVVTHSEVIARRLRNVHTNVRVIAPSINPFTPKNRNLSRRAALAMLRNHGINPSKPIIAQVGRFTSQKDPLSAVRIHSKVKVEIPDTQLILAGLFNLSNDPDTQKTLDKILEKANSQEGLFVFSDLSQINGISNDAFINALYTASDVVLSMGKNEAFGIATLEAMWQQKVVVARCAPGPLLLINNGKDGFIISSISEASEKVVDALRDTELRKRLGISAHEKVRSDYLHIRYLFQILTLYKVLNSKINQN